VELTLHDVCTGLRASYPERNMLVAMRRVAA
jgi:hypothetical protein